MRPGRAPAALSAVFLDRDGVLNRKAPEGDYVRSWAQFAWLPGALDALRALGELDVPVVVVTNQRGVARGLMTLADVEEIHTRLLADVAAAGGRIDRIELCPHESGTCDCRKPGTAMFERAREAIPAIDLATSAMVGDSASDMEAARRIGALAVLVRAGGDGGDAAGLGADLVVEDLLAAAEHLRAEHAGAIEGEG